MTGNVSVEAVLIPARIAKTVFGKEISNNYAIIALTISNRSSDDAFIVHSVFIDYSEWLLSGASPFPQQNNAPCSAPLEETNASAASGTASNNAPPRKRQGNCLHSWQQETTGNQIDSVETRIVRGQLLDRQPWTTRNWVLRSLVAAGSIAFGFTFATSSDSWIRGIGAFNSSVIPAAQAVWPDATVGQMNRISDFGFQVNKVIAKQSSDIVVAFFPIERFLTPDLASLFISSPAIFFSPLAALADPKVKERMKWYLRDVFTEGKKGSEDKDAEIGNLKAHLYQVVRGDCEKLESSSEPAAADSLGKACETAELVNRLSLNVVRIRVSGSMTVDVDKVPPQITEVDIDTPAGKDAVSMWAKGANLIGVIRGSFLGGGTPAVKGIDNKILQIQADANSSNDTELHFTITLNDDLPAGTNSLNFQASKTSDGATITSAIHNFPMQIPPKADANPGATGSDKSQGATATETKDQGGAAGGTSSAQPVTPKPPKPKNL